MELKTAAASVLTEEILLDARAEIPVEGDFFIPDYQPEIFKIIKALGETAVVQRSVGGGRALVEGYCTLNVIYSSPEGELAGFSQKIPFSKSFEMKVPAESAAFISVEIQPEYSNCRAVNGRRIDYHGAFFLAVKVKAPKSEELVASAFGDGVQTRSAPVSYTVKTGYGERIFSLEEEIAERASGRVVRSEYRAETEEARISEDRVLVKGTVHALLALYSEGEYRTLKSDIPFSQLIELTKGSENAEVFAQAEVLSASVTNEDEVFSLNLSCRVSADIYESAETELITDLYSTEYECECALRTLQLERIRESEKREISGYFEVDVPDNGEILDVFAHSAVHTEGRAVNLTLCAVLRGDEGETQCIEAPVTLETGIEDSYEPFIENIRMQFRRESGKLVVEPTVRLCGPVFMREKVDAVQTVRCVGEEKKKRIGVAAVVRYGEGGDIWQTAKDYNSPADAIRSIEGKNGLRALIIPINE